MTYTLVAANEPDPAEEQAILDGLRAYNLEQVPDSGPFGTFAVSIKDGAGKTAGGLWARYGLDWMFVELLFVPEDLRGGGLGLEMMEKAEARARELALTGIWLDTFAFQARGFYEKLGYDVFGVIEDHPKGSRLYLLRKYLSPSFE